MKIIQEKQLPLLTSVENNIRGNSAITFRQTEVNLKKKKSMTVNRTHSSSGFTAPNLRKLVTALPPLGWSQRNLHSPSSEQVTPHPASLVVHSSRLFASTNAGFPAQVVAATGGGGTPPWITHFSAALDFPSRLGDPQLSPHTQPGLLLQQLTKLLSQKGALRSHCWPQSSPLSPPQLPGPRQLPARVPAPGTRVLRWLQAHG